VAKRNGRAKWEPVLENIDSSYHAFVQAAVTLAKEKALGVFGEIEDRHEWNQIVSHYNLAEHLDENQPVATAIDHAIDALKISNKLGRAGLWDFSDMIYLPVLFGCRMNWQYDFVLVDEGQDTNPARRALARKLMKPNGRILFVGDEAQAIFGFTGADSDSVNIIKKDFNCIELPLTVTYRCPKAVVKAAQAYVSHIQAHPSAPEGVVETLEAQSDLTKPENLAKLHKDDAILCRKTAPLVDLAYTLIRNKIGCHVEGRDIGEGLLLIVNKWKVKSTAAFLDKLDTWETKQVERLTAKGNETGAEAIEDKAATVRILCENTQTLDQVREKIAALFTNSENGKSDTLTLSTVHKAKGREWNTVYVLGFNEYMPSPRAKQAWERAQENNLIYVAFTRAKNKLVLVG
jgi:DNA helicase-2/ATP-dependent DNA helicase PcrA